MLDLEGALSNLVALIYLPTCAWLITKLHASDHDPDSCPRVRHGLAGTRRSNGQLTITNRIFEDDSTSVVEIRTENLQALRELGPPDLVHLVKQPVKSTSKSVRNAPRPPEAAPG